MIKNRLTIISFDVSTDAAAQEQREDRSLNLLLRQQRMHSEIFRLSLEPAKQQIDYLAEILMSSPPRPIVFLAREIEHYPAQKAAVLELAINAVHALIVSIGNPTEPWLALPKNVEWMHLPSDQSAEIAALALTLIARESAKLIT